MFYKRFWLIGCVVLMFLSAGCGILPAEEEQIAPPLTEPERQAYRTAVVERKDIVYAVRGNATLESSKVYSLSFPDARKIKSVDVKRGDMVQKGDVLIAAETGDLADQITRQEYAVQNQQIAVDNAQFAVRRAQIAIDSLVRDTSRADKNTAAYKDKKELAEMDLSQAQNGLAQAQLGLSQAQWELDNLQEQYEGAQLVAPISGKAIFVENIKVGEFSTPDASLVSVAVPDMLQAAFVTSDLDLLSQVKTGMSAQLTYDGETYPEAVTMSADTVPPDASLTLSRSILVSADGLPEGVRIGEQVRLLIAIETSEDTLVIPRDALRTFLGQTKVNVLDPENPDGAPEERSVEVGIETDTEVEILAGLAEGETVILQ